MLWLTKKCENVKVSSQLIATTLVAIHQISFHLDGCQMLKWLVVKKKHFKTAKIQNLPTMTPSFHAPVQTPKKELKSLKSSKLAMLRAILIVEMARRTH